MNLKSFLKKEKINKIYSYREVRKDKYSVEFGWAPSDTINLNKPVVISYPSKGKGISDKDREWSLEEGKNASSLDDYKKYFSALTGEPPDIFIDMWADGILDLESLREKDNPGYRDGEGRFLYSLALLISTGKKFTEFGRIYKIINVNT